ncbi:MAG TPA: bifunctional hydroxymethylpyrimidine kinase/phosphomethylpyrimidine kinase [Verrucomicrobiae bacterium]|nr:bifunctional hydroxymethylpyrimidine kinase/phosphomethylpyrimidine kinase [Verrucomicrobiae bacterium]
MMPKPKTIPIALTIAGSDSSGGAGIQADLKTFAALGVHGTSALTCVTAQNPRRVLAIQACRPEIVRGQIEAVMEELPPAAVKTGMLYSAEIIRVVADFFRGNRRTPLVVDPVMISTSGSRLLKPSAIKRLKNELLPLATLVTPNLDEAIVLTGRRLKSPEDLRWAARKIHGDFGCAALIKGGHLRSSKEAVDIFFDGANELLLSAPFVKGVHTHGTGCTYSAAITGFLARDYGLPEAVVRGKEFISQAIAQSQGVGRHSVLNSFWKED